MLCNTYFDNSDCSNDKTYLFVWLGSEIDHATAYGRIAFSIPHAEQPEIQKRIKNSGHKILTDLITLDTPGKASVRVIILADPVRTFQIFYFWMQYNTILIKTY